MDNDTISAIDLLERLQLEDFEKLGLDPQLTLSRGRDGVPARPEEIYGEAFQAATGQRDNYLKLVRSVPGSRYDDPTIRAELYNTARLLIEHLAPPFRPKTPLIGISPCRTPNAFVCSSPHIQRAVILYNKGMALFFQDAANAMARMCPLKPPFSDVNLEDLWFGAHSEVPRRCYDAAPWLLKAVLNTIFKFNGGVETLVSQSFDSKADPSLLTENEISLSSQINLSISTFVLAHEIGHIVVDNNVKTHPFVGEDVPPDVRALFLNGNLFHETFADDIGVQLAFHLCRELGVEVEIYYAAVSMFFLLNGFVEDCASTIRDGQPALNSKKEGFGETHPGILNRLQLMHESMSKVIRDEGVLNRCYTMAHSWDAVLQMQWRGLSNMFQAWNADGVADDLSEDFRTASKFYLSDDIGLYLKKNTITQDEIKGIVLRGKLV